MVYTISSTTPTRPERVEDTTDNLPLAQDIAAQVEVTLRLEGVPYYTVRVTGDNGKVYCQLRRIPPIAARPAIAVA